MKIERVMPIGQFARLSLIPTSTLRFYDESGVFQPLHTDPETHYRYYGLEQLETAMAIRYLREIDVPLGDIKEALQTGGAQVESLLRLYRYRIEERKADLERAAKRVEGLLSSGRAVLGYRHEVVDLRPMQVVSRRAEPHRTEIDDAVEDLSGELRRAIGVKESAENTPREIVLYPSVLRRKDVVEITVCVPLPKGSDHVEGSWELPGGKAARLLHLGPYDDIYLAYMALLCSILRSGHEFEGPLREVYLVDNRDTSLPSEYVTEVTWRFT
jgi:DNA-binding transcriptional MerR regulator